MAQETRAILMLEIAGRPADHVKQSLIAHVDKFKIVKGVKVINASISEPQEIEGHKEFFTCFSEVEVETDSFEILTDLIFEFMPSSVEVVDPGEIRLDTASATNLMNRLTGRLHRYDEIAKIVKMQNEQLVRKIQELEQSQGESKSVKAKPVKKAKGKS